MVDRIRRRWGVPFELWFWDHAVGPPSPRCREWRGGTNQHGYGVLRDEHGRLDKAHRVAWRLANGPIPDGAQVLHHCDNPPCCEPTCLFLGNHLTNMGDASAKGRLHANTCRRDGGRFVAR